MAGKRGRPRKDGTKDLNTRISEALAGLETIAEDAHEVAKDANLLPVIESLSQFSKIRKRWESTPDLFDGDDTLKLKMRDSWIRITVTIMDSLEQILGQIYDQIAKTEGDEGTLTLHERLRIFESLSSQWANFQNRKREGEPPPERKALPETEDELDRRLAAAEEEAKRIKNAKPITVTMVPESHT